MYSPYLCTDLFVDHVNFTYYYEQPRGEESDCFLSKLQKFTCEQNTRRLLLGKTWRVLANLFLFVAFRARVTRRRRRAITIRFFFLPSKLHGRARFPGPLTHSVIRVPFTEYRASQRDYRGPGILEPFLGFCSSFLFAIVQIIHEETIVRISPKK